MIDLKKKLSAAEGKLSAAEDKIVSAEKRLSAAERSGSWCAYQDSWGSSNSVIKYDRLLHVASNMKKNALNTGTGEI